MIMFCILTKNYYQVIRAFKKQFFIVDTTYQALKNNFSYFRVARKHQKANFHTSAWRGNDLKEMIKESPANINLRGLYHSHSYAIKT